MDEEQEAPPGGSEPARTAGRVPEPYERDAGGKPVQPQDRPPARPHLTVTHEPEPSPHEVPDDVGEGE